jgi:hypothetical protein
MEGKSGPLRARKPAYLFAAAKPASGGRRHLIGVNRVPFMAARGNVRTISQNATFRFEGRQSFGLYFSSPCFEGYRDTGFDGIVTRWLWGSVP